MKNFKLKIEEKIETHIVNHFVYVHLEIPKISEEYLKEKGRVNYSTPKNYLDFLNNFKKIYDETHKKCIEDISRFKLGLGKLEEAANKIADL